MDRLKGLPGLPVAWLVLCALASVLVSLVYHGWLSFPSLGLDYEVPRDFLCFWVGGKAVWLDAAEKVFSPSGFIALKRAIAGAAYPRLYWLYPPHFLMFVAPFGLFSYAVGFVLWTLASLALWFAACRVALPRSPAAQGWAVLSPAVLWAVPYGQNGLIFGSLAIFAYHFSDRRPWLAGLFAALLTMKPQVAPIIAVVFLAQLNWRAIASGIFGTAVLVGASIWTLGVEPWRDYIAIMTNRGARVTFTRTDVLHQQATLLAGLRQVGVSLDLATSIHIVAAAAAAVTAAIVIIKTRDSARWLAPVIFLNTFIPPYTLVYDIIPAAAATALLALSPPPGGAGRLIAMLAWVLPILVVPLNSAGLPPGPPILAAATILALLRLRDGRRVSAAALPALP